MRAQSNETRCRTRVALLLCAAMVISASCGAPDIDSGPASGDDFETQNRIELERMSRDAFDPEDEGEITAAADDINPEQPTTPPTSADDEWSYTVTLEFVTETFEGAIDAADYVFTATIVRVSDPRWNTADGRLGGRADWVGAAVQPYQWQQIDVMLAEDVRGNLTAAPGEELRLIYGIAEPYSHPFDDSAVGASLLVGAGDWTVEYLDGTTVDGYDIHSQATYVSFPGGPAVRLLDARTGNWHTFGGASAVMPDATTVDVARSLDELVERARHPDTPLEEQLGYDQIYGPRDPNPDAAEVVP